MSRFGSSDGGGLLFIPYFVLVMLVIAGNTPSHIPGLEGLELGLFFAPLFFISLNSEGDFTPVALALIGLLSDLLREAPLGYWAFLFVIFYALCRFQKPILHNAAFVSHWLTFAVLTAAVYLLGYFIALMRDDMAVAGSQLLLSLFLCLIAFPVIFGPLFTFRDRLLVEDKG